MPDVGEALLDDEDVGVTVEGADVEEDVAGAAGPVSFFEAAPESVDSPDGGFILLE